MGPVLYREIEEKDYPAVGEILNQAFGLHRYVSDKQELVSFQMQYVYSCLTEATYTRVAERDGSVCGVIMGHAKAERRKRKHLSYLAQTIRYSLKMRRDCRDDQTELDDYKNLHRVYAEFLRRHSGEFDGVLTLFAVEKDCRGLGVGKQLLTGLLDDFQRQGCHRFYLYTDSTCSYEFYEHMGFERLEEQQLRLTRDGSPFDMQVFLYGSSL